MALSDEGFLVMLYLIMTRAVNVDDVWAVLLAHRCPMNRLHTAERRSSVL